MKKALSLIAILALLGFVFPPTSAEAGSYRSKYVGKCSCGQPIYAQYRPVRASCGTISYAWVKQSHTCRNHSSRYSRGYSSRSYSSPSYSSRSYNSYRRPSSSYSYQYRPSYRYSRGGSTCR